MHWEDGRPCSCTTLGKPVPTPIFLALNDIVLFVTEQLRRGGTGRRWVGAAAYFTVA